MAPVTEHQGSFLSRISRRNQIVSMDVNHEQELEELEDFQKHVAERFTELLSPSTTTTASDSPESDPVLSIQWLRKLLDAFMSCESEFQAVLTTNPAQISKPPLDKLVPEMLDRIIKALDICTAVVNGVDSVRQSQRLAEIAVTAFKQRPLSDGSVRRAKRALTSLLNADKNIGSDGGSGRRSTTTEQWSSFGRRSGGGGGGGCVSKNWSASKQIQAMTANLVAPRGTESSPIYIMSSLMVMVMWTLVVAVPCQASNGLTVYLPLPKHQVWASAAVSIHEMIGEEVKRKEKRCGGGLMEEMQRMERIGLKLMEFSEAFRFGGEEEVAVEVAEMEEICRKMEDGLEGLQRRVRQVFHRLVKSRSEILEMINQCNI